MAHTHVCLSSSWDAKYGNRCCGLSPFWPNWGPNQIHTFSLHSQVTALPFNYTPYMNGVKGHVSINGHLELIKTTKIQNLFAILKAPRFARSFDMSLKTHSSGTKRQTDQTTSHTKNQSVSFQSIWIPPVPLRDTSQP